MTYDCIQAQNYLSDYLETYRTHIFIDSDENDKNNNNDNLISKRSLIHDLLVIWILKELWM